MEKTTGQHYDYWLPSSDLEHAERGSFYYKEVQRPRESQNLLSLRVGIRVCQISHFQEDHLLYLTQILNASLDWCHLVVIGRVYIFLESTLVFRPEEQISQEFIERERALLNRLKQQSQAISQIIDEDLNGQSLLSQNFTLQQLGQKIEKLREKMKSKDQHRK